MAMTQEELISLAKEAGAGLALTMSSPQRISDALFRGASLTRFAELVAAAEREACAKACDEIETDRWNLYKGRNPYTGAEHGRASAHTQGESCGASACADAIRARGEE